MRLRRSQGGFTIVEVACASAIAGLIAVNLAMVMRASAAAYETGVLKKLVDEQAEMTMDRIALAVMSSSEQELYPVVSSPLCSPRIDYQTCLGVQDGALVMGDLERIEYVEQPSAGTVVWTESPGSSASRSVVWSSWVPRFLEGETPNGADDNGNGLVDEAGLTFDSSGPKVHIRLTVERKDEKGQLFRRTLASTVTCRN